VGDIELENSMVLRKNKLLGTFENALRSTITTEMSS
jgi:hypothetical protein